MPHRCPIRTSYYSVGIHSWNLVSFKCYKMGQKLVATIALHGPNRLPFLFGMTTSRASLQLVSRCLRRKQTLNRLLQEGNMSSALFFHHKSDPVQPPYSVGKRDASNTRSSAPSFSWIINVCLMRQRRKAYS